jgi:hypothetical protein
MNKESVVCWAVVTINPWRLSACDGYYAGGVPRNGFVYRPKLAGYPLSEVKMRGVEEQENHGSLLQSRMKEEKQQVALEALFPLGPASGSSQMR